MNWVVRISAGAQLFIDQLSPKPKRQITRSINQMEQDPFRGDVRALQGEEQGEEWRGYYRKRVGDFRVIFFPHRQKRIVDVGWVLLRSEKTYR